MKEAYAEKNEQLDEVLVFKQEFMNMLIHPKLELRTYGVLLVLCSPNTDGLKERLVLF